MRNHSWSPTRVSRRQALELLAATFVPAVLAGCGAPAPSAAPAQAAPTAPPAAAPIAPASGVAATAVQVAPTAAPGAPKPSTARPDWIAAAKPYAGQTLNGLVSTEDSGKLIGQLAEEFGQLTGMNIKVEQVPTAGYPPKLQAELVSRSGNLDFMAMLIGDIAQYVKAGLLEPLDAYLQNPAFPDYALDDFPATVLDVWARNKGQVFALPALGGAQIMYYRKDLFDQANIKPPQTWPELYDVGKKLRQGDVWAAALGLKGSNPSFRIPNAFAPGGQWFDKDMRLSVLRDPRTIENIDVWARMFKDGLLPQDDLANDTNATYAIYQAGKAATLPMAWPVFVPNIVDPAKSKAADVTGFVPVPGGGPNAAGWSYVVSSDSKHKEAAYLAISWVTNPQNSARQILSGGISDAGMRRSIYTDSFRAELAKQPHGASEVEALSAQSQSWPNAHTVPTIAEWPKMQDVIGPLIQRVVTGDISAHDGLNQAADGCEKILQEAGYYKA